MGDRELEPDCARCVGLCCVVLPFQPSAGRAGFAFAKQAGEPCRHLRPDHRCGVHSELPRRGMGGCVSYDCLGAGQYVVGQHPGAGAAELREEFLVVERLHELLVLLDRARELTPTDASLTDLRSRVASARDRSADVDALTATTGAALDRVSRAVRGAGAPSYRHADLAGRDLRAVDLARADLRGAVLIGADLRGVVLDRTDLLGADLRDADLRGADLATALFTTRPQLARALLA